MCWFKIYNLFTFFCQVEEAPKKKAAPAEKKKGKKIGDVEMMDVE